VIVDEQPQILSQLSKRELHLAILAHSPGSSARPPKT
jgi:hypothetical protein